MQQSLNFAAPSMDWQDFRTWLGSHFEQEEFSPHNQPSSVQLMNFKQAQYCHFDALIIASANKENLPGSTRQQAFFNQSVRTELNLPNWHQEKQQAFQRFRCLLESADNVLISFCSEKNGEWQPTSPWVNSIIDYAELVLKQNLQDFSLHTLLQHAESDINECDIDSLPAPPQNPAPILEKKLIPLSYSASRHQRLINCPYQFFSADVLALKANEKISEELQKSEYGEKVHLILQAFHSQVKNLPAPFKKPINADNREQALQHMSDLSTQVFNKNTEDNVTHRDWLRRWLSTSKLYIDWQIEHQKEWQIHALERQETVHLSDALSIKGRLDRVDKQNDQLSIIDYKTGASAKQDKINAGEDVQLVSYAAMLPGVNQVAYLELNKDKVKLAAHLEDEQLTDLKNQSQDRLLEMIEQMNQATPLRAWGDEKTCQYCEMQGLCRKQVWK